MFTFCKSDILAILTVLQKFQLFIVVIEYFIELCVKKNSNRNGSSKIFLKGYGEWQFIMDEPGDDS